MIHRRTVLASTVLFPLGLALPASAQQDPAVAFIQRRGEQLLALNTQLYADLQRAHAAEDFEALQTIFARYHAARGATYFMAATGCRS